MLTSLFSGAVNNLLGRESIKSAVYGYDRPNVEGYDSVGGCFYLEAAPHLFDKTKYALAEISTSSVSRQLTPPDLKKYLQTSTSTQIKSLKDENGRALALTREDVLKKMADYEAELDRQCQNKGSHYVAFYRLPAGQKPGASASAP